MSLTPRCLSEVPTQLSSSTPFLLVFKGPYKVGNLGSERSKSKPQYLLMLGLLSYARSMCATRQILKDMLFTDIMRLYVILQCLLKSTVIGKAQIFRSRSIEADWPILYDHFHSLISFLYDQVKRVLAAYFLQGIEHVLDCDRDTG